VTQVKQPDQLTSSSALQRHRFGAIVEYYWLRAIVSGFPVQSDELMVLIHYQIKDTIDALRSQELPDRTGRKLNALAIMALHRNGLHLTLIEGLVLLGGNSQPE
jgi:hypothetical protein